MPSLTSGGRSGGRFRFLIAKNIHLIYKDSMTEARNSRSFGNVESYRNIDHLRAMGERLYIMGRLTLATVLHPVATVRAVLLVGDRARIERDIRIVSILPKIPKGRNRFFV